MRKLILFLCSVLPSLYLFSQSLNVTGVVKSSDGEVVSANVQIKGTTRGVSTDAQGRYSIQNVPGNATLVFSAVGYKTAEISLNGNSVADATLQRDAQARISAAMQRGLQTRDAEIDLTRVLR